MARGKSPLQIRLEYYPARALGWLLSLLPGPWARRACYGILRGVLFLIPRRRALIRQNLAAAFPAWPVAERERVARASIQSLAKSAAAFVRLPHLWKNSDPGWIVSHNLHYLEESLRRGRGTLAFTAHYGCWELMAMTTMRRYPRVALVYREMDNPWLDRWVANLRTSAGGEAIPRRSLLRQGLRLLRDNGILGILVDQNFAAGGVFVDFFGRPAATTPIVSILARRTGASVLPCHNRWIGDELHIFWEAPLPLSQRSDPEEAIAEDTARMTKVVESWIKEDPTQWLWLHNRWKRQPKEGERLY